MAIRTRERLARGPDRHIRGHIGAATALHFRSARQPEGAPTSTTRAGGAETPPAPARTWASGQISAWWSTPAWSMSSTANNTRIDPSFGSPSTIRRSVRNLQGRSALTGAHLGSTTSSRAAARASTAATAGWVGSRASRTAAATSRGSGLMGDTFFRSHHRGPPRHGAPGTYDVHEPPADPKRSRSTKRRITLTVGPSGPNHSAAAGRRPGHGAPRNAPFQSMNFRPICAGNAPYTGDTANG